MKKLIGFGIGAVVVGIGVFCWRVNEQWKKDCEEAKHYVDIMHAMTDPWIMAYNNVQEVTHEP